MGGVEIVKEGGNTTYRRYVGGVLLQTVTGSTVTSRYLFHDQLGSVVRVADASGVAVDSGDYTALGERRSYSDPLVSGTPLASTPRGYTGHEMLDSVGLIYMLSRGKFANGAQAAAFAYAFRASNKTTKERCYAR